MAKQKAPRKESDWIDYYEALDKGITKDKFRGSCRRSKGTWIPITAYFKHKGISISTQRMLTQHVWSLPKRRYWKETLDSGSIKDYEDTAQKTITPKEFDSDNSFITKYDTELLTPHHLISISVTKAIHSYWRRIIVEDIGYNVNSAYNLVILTNSADLACHLAIPLHEGNHTSGHRKQGISVDDYNKYAKAVGQKGGTSQSIWDLPDRTVQDSANYDEVQKQMVLKAYHSRVFKALSKVLEKHFKECDDIDDKEFIEDMNALSLKILKKIKNFKWVLHKTGKDYRPKSKNGCRNVRVRSALTPGQNKVGYDSTVGEQRKLDEQMAGKQLPVCTLNRDHDYLNELFPIPIRCFSR